MVLLGMILLLSWVIRINLVQRAGSRLHLYLSSGLTSLYEQLYNSHLLYPQYGADTKEPFWPNSRAKEGGVYYLRPLAFGKYPICPYFVRVRLTSTSVSGTDAMEIKG